MKKPVFDSVVETMKGIGAYITICVLSVNAFNATANVITQKEYIDRWKNEAVSQMQLYQIPASITMAQAILESSSGNSKLAREGKNHFGIKCHSWNGKTMSLDDDKSNECFRVYERVEDSYEDHSLFLKKQKRYAHLFQLATTDYVAWAKGLKASGYAINPNYAELLIELIEKQNLAVLDGSSFSTLIANNISDGRAIKNVSHQVIQHKNKVNYVVAKKGDTYVRLAKEFKLGLWQLYKYNDFASNKEVLEEGDIVYIQPKRKRTKLNSVTLTTDMTLREVSQQNAIYLNRLVKLNQVINPDIKIPKGTKITLR